MDDELKKLRALAGIIAESNEKIERVEVSNLLRELANLVQQPIVEKWGNGYETPKKLRGKFDGKSKEELEKRRNELRKKKDHTAAETKELREINFALRSKSGWGKVPESAEMVDAAEMIGEETDDDENEELDEKHIGFKNLEKELSHRKDVKDPGAVAHAIGVKKYGKKAMKNAAASHKKLG